jgi:hypothetical protein
MKHPLYPPHPLKRRTARLGVGFHTRKGVAVDHDLQKTDFGVLVLWRPAQMTTPPLIERLATWRVAVRRRTAQPCLFCPRLWSDEAEPPPAALICLRDQPSVDPLPICAACASRFPDDEALADQAMVLAKYRWWPVVNAQRVYVDQESSVANAAAESGEPRLIEIGQIRLG